jgi:ABC-type Fe3+ transport system substrate-binding protein
LPYAQFHGQQFLVNTKLVDISKLKSYEDLLDPKFAGKIVVGHPKDVGQSRYSFGFLYSYYGEDFFKKLAAQKPVVVKDVKQLIEWVAHGKYAIGIGPGNAAAYKELVDAGIPVTGMVLKEGGYYSPGYNNVAIVKDAPHPNAAKLFINWIFTREGQEVIVDALGGSSVRTDVTNPLTFDKSKKYYAPHFEKSEDIQHKAIEAFNKYIPQ